MRRTWRYIEENDVSAHYGLATDEQLMTPYVAEAEPEFQATLRLYNYVDHCALVGRFQNIHAELDLESCDVQGIQYGRRQTGGGAIIMGRDQLGLCVTCSSKSFEWTNIRDLCYLFSKPVIAALSTLGIKAEFRAKNDLEVDGKKIAGLGVYIDPQGAIQFHLSLLLDLDILKMLSVLQIPIQKYSDKRKVNAVSQRMATVSGLAGRKVSQNDIRELIRESFEVHFQANMIQSEISSDECIEIDQLISDKYLTKDWIEQNTPQADLTGMSLKKTPAGLLRIYIGLKGEIIKSVLITGDFIEFEHIFKKIEAELKWSPLDKEKILEVVSDVLQKEQLVRANTLDQSTTNRTVEGISNVKASITADELTETIFLAAQKAYNADQHTYQGTCYYPKREKETVLNREAEALNKSTV